MILVICENCDTINSFHDGDAGQMLSCVTCDQPLSVVGDMTAAPLFGPYVPGELPNQRRASTPDVAAWELVLCFFFGIIGLIICRICRGRLTSGHVWALFAGLFACFVFFFFVDALVSNLRGLR